jgi:diaminopimelate decarboxylase/aspartate kinase
MPSTLIKQVSMSQTPFRVLKFGGTSVSTAKNWEKIFHVLLERKKLGKKVIVVCSAMSQVTSTLELILKQAKNSEDIFWQQKLQKLEEQHQTLVKDLGLAEHKECSAFLEEIFQQWRRLLKGVSLTQEYGPQLQAKMMSTGELLSTKIGSCYLRQQGLSALWCDVRHLLKSKKGEERDPWNEFLSAKCEVTPSLEKQKEWLAMPSDVFVTQGFIAEHFDGGTVCLGRGGSDTSASYLSVLFQADLCEIWTDVPGLFTADPRYVPSARILKYVSSLEAQEMASLGAKVLHPRCLPPLRQYDIPLKVYSTERPDLEGTLIQSRPEHLLEGQIKAVAMRTQGILLGIDNLHMWQEVGFLAGVFQVFKKYQLSVDLLSTSETNLTLTLDPQSNFLTQEKKEQLKQELGLWGQLKWIEPCSIISLVGDRIRQSLYRLGPTFKLLEDKQVYMITKAMNDLNVSMVVPQEEGIPLLQKIHHMIFEQHYFVLCLV